MSDHLVTYNVVVKELAPTETSVTAMLNRIAEAVIKDHAVNDCNVELVSASVATRPAR